jgi:hypothetical protein
MAPYRNPIDPIRLPFNRLLWSVWASAVLCITFTLSAAPISYNSVIRPIFVEHCLACHGHDAEKRKGDLRLDIDSESSQSVIVPEHPGKSELIDRITSKNSDEIMPPHDSGKPLSQEQIRALQQWIAEGAQYENHWAFEPIQDPAPPSVTDISVSDIDRFVLATLKSKGLEMSPPISRQQLIRRATFDLIGLPPFKEEVEAFVYDASAEAFEKVVDRLLESPRYGERWGRHWLDIARYADTHGGAAIGFKKFPFSYTYRDYVISAFNQDLPYDQFITEQLAADQLGLNENDSALAALGFLTVGQQFPNPNDTIDDQIDVITRGFLGLTVTCARCHDHKYDAIPTTDYYSLYATFAPSESPKLLPTVGEPTDSESYQEYQEELRKRQINYQDMARDQSAVMRGRLRMQVGLYLRELAKGVPEQDLTAAFLSYRTDDLRPHILEAWRSYLAQRPESDPVFGPWVRLSKLPPTAFTEECSSLLAELRSQNGESEKQKPLQTFASSPPRWNPRVIDALEKKHPTNLLEVADAYGELFAIIHQEWLQSIIESATEAIPGTKPVPDEDIKHLTINSPVNRQLRRHLFSTESPLGMPDSEAVNYLNRPIRDNVSGRNGAIHNLHLNSPGSPPRAMALREDPSDRAFHVMQRGNPLDRGQPVTPRFLTALTTNHSEPFRPGKRRLGLARALVHESNPLTRRVIVNWVWQHHFGQGLVRTPDDFGTRGRPPTHPKLLDYLASKFQDDRWSIKRLHRRIMLSTTYQQAAIENGSSRIQDPENESLWRMPRRRLDLESMRDAMLKVSGELSPRVGGRPFDLLSSPVVPRRSVYAFVNRDIVSSLASTFDAANPTSCTAKRPETNVPQQTLFALNSSFIQDRAKALAAHQELDNVESDEERIRRMYQRCFSRPPDPDDLRIALTFIQSQPSDSETDPWQRFAHALLASNEFVFVD